MTVPSAFVGSRSSGVPSPSLSNATVSPAGLPPGAATVAITPGSNVTWSVGSPVSRARASCDTPAAGGAVTVNVRASDHGLRASIPRLASHARARARTETVPPPTGGSNVNVPSSPAVVVPSAIPSPSRSYSTHTPAASAESTFPVTVESKVTPSPGVPVSRARARAGAGGAATGRNP